MARVPLKKVFARVNSAGSEVAERALNFIGRGACGITIAADNTDGELDVTIGGATEAHTASDTLTAAETGSTHTNLGAAGAITLTLPAAAVGLEFTFYVAAAQTLTIQAVGNDTIRIGTAAAGAAAGSAAADAEGEWVTLRGISTTQWVSIGSLGTWTVA